MPELSWAEWDAKAKYRAVHIKYNEQLKHLKDWYPDRLDKLIRRRDDILAGHDWIPKEDFLLLEEQIARITDKYETVLKELEGRKLGYFKRKLIGTLYYIDLDGGNNGNNGLDHTTSWLTFEQYSTTTIRSPGDIAKVRANTDEVVAGNTAFDEAGDEDNWIEIRGCSSIDDPWGDGSNVKPVRSYADGEFRAAIGVPFWKISRIIFKESSSASGNVGVSGIGTVYFSNVEFTDNSNAAGCGIHANSYTTVIFDTCSFKDNLKDNLRARLGIYAKLNNCAFNGGVTTTDYGIYASEGAKVEAIDCSFGQTTAHDIADITALSGAIVKTRNCNLKVAATVASKGGAVFSEDPDLITYYQGTVTPDTDIKTGNAAFSLKFEPNTYCGLNEFLTPNNDSIIEWPFTIQCAADVEKTVTVKIRSLGTWGTYPTASELFLEFWYLDHAVNATRTKVVSTQVLNHASNWIDFTVTFTPLQEGAAYGTVKLGKFEDAGDGCHVNGETEVS